MCNSMSVMFLFNTNTFNFTTAALWSSLNAVLVLHRNFFKYVPVGGAEDVTFYIILLIATGWWAGITRIL